MDYTVTIQEEAEKITHAVFHKSSYRPRYDTDVIQS